MPESGRGCPALLCVSEGRGNPGLRSSPGELHVKRSLLTQGVLLWGSLGVSIVTFQLGVPAAGPWLANIPLLPVLGVLRASREHGSKELCLILKRMRKCMKEWMSTWRGVN